ncbi:MAG: T9SS type A sorting domain-containing protein [Chitinophagaceae bacterium]
MRSIFFILFIGLFVNVFNASGQCIGNTSWVGGVPSPETLSGTGIILGTVQVKVRSQGSFAAGRPGYGISSDIYGGFSYESLLAFRGASFAAGTYTSFKLQTPLDANYIHLRVRDIRGDGINTEHQRVRGFLNGVAVSANFVDPQNGAFITGGNIINGAGTTTPLIQSSMRAFFTGPVDSIVVISTALSDYVVIDLFARCDILLPFQLLDFTGQQVKQSIFLQWKTGAEENILGYEIERSEDGKKWIKSGSVKVQGMDVPEKKYQFYDNNPINGKNYYRLVSNESDGESQYSNVLMIDFFSDNIRSISIFPNPVLDELNISIDAQNIKIIKAELFTSDGKLIIQSTPNSIAFKIDSKKWHKGIYILQLTTSKGDIVSQKIIRN